MSIGDGVRRNITTVSQEERNRLRDAFILLNRRYYPGDRDEIPAGGVSHWFKQDEIHQSTHVHAFAPWRGIAFLTWHRELCNRLEDLLREVDPELSLHYWDWTTDPNPSDGSGLDLFTPDFMGAANGSAGEPWRSAGFYDPATPLHRDATGNPFDPPRSLIRNVGAGAPALPWSDDEIVAADTFPAVRRRLEDAHNGAHGYIGGTIANAHTSFRDPFVFLLHSNVDRLFALWQLQPGKEWRLDPEQVYGSESNTDVIPGASIYDPGILTPLDPWAGNPNNHPAVGIIRPWAAPENEHLRPENRKNSKHPSVVAPRRYDTNPRRPAWLISEGGTGRWRQLNTSVVRLPQLAFGDFTGDGKTDVFRADGTKWFISEGGTGKWREINTSSVRLQHLAFGDFTGDGKTDVFRADGTTWFISEGGTGKWREINTSAVRLPDLAFGDFTGDGKTDVFRADGTTWFISEGGTGKWRRINTSAVRLPDLAFGDFSGDGKTDVFRADGTTWFISEGGTGKWREINTSSVRLQHLAFGDFTGDGKTDVFRADGTKWFISEGGTGKWREINTSSVRLQHLAFGDFTGDGKTDVFRTGLSVP